MVAYSNYLNSHPIDLALTLGQYDKPQRRFVGDKVQMDVYSDGVHIHTTGSIGLHSLKNHYSVVDAHPRSSSSVRLDVTLTRFRRGFPYSARYRSVLPFQAQKNGSVRFALNGQQVRSSRQFKQLMSRVQGISKNPWVRRSRSVQRSTNLRPSPERLTRQFLRVHEAFTAGVQTDFSQTVVPVTSYYREWTGTRTPGYGKLKSRQLPDNPHTVRVTEVQDNRYHWFQVQPASGNSETRVYPYSEIYAMPDSPTLFVTASEFDALQKLINRAQVGLQANMAQNIAQVSQLSSLIFSNATRIGKALMAVKKGNLLGAARTLLAAQPHAKWQGPVGKLSASKSVASNWLQLQYGWKPLLSDIEGMMIAAGRLNSPNDTVQRVSSSASASREYSVDYPPGNAVIGFNNGGKTVFTVRSRTAFKIRFRVDSPLTSFLAQTGFTNPINLGWEILPFSFVVDWFLPIGNYLQALSAWHGVTFLGGSKVQFTRIKGDSTISYHGASVIEPTVFVDHTATQTREEVRLSRIVLSDFPSPVLPSFNADGIQAGNRAANAIALLTGFFRR